MRFLFNVKKSQIMFCVFISLSFLTVVCCNDFVFGVPPLLECSCPIMAEVPEGCHHTVEYDTNNCPVKWELICEDCDDETDGGDIKCPANQTYHQCASCQMGDCFDHHLIYQDCTCIPGCMCKEGFVRWGDNQICIPITECPDLTPFEPKPCANLAQFRHQALTAINQLRAQHSAPPLQIHDGINGDAQSYAESAEQIKEFIPGYGDVLYGETFAKYSKGTTGANAVHMVYLKGRQVYDYSNPIKNLKWDTEAVPDALHSPGYNFNAAYYADMIWKSAKQFGIGCGLSKDGEHMFAVIMYLPRVTKQTVTNDLLKENVLPLVT